MITPLHHCTYNIGSSHLRAGTPCQDRSASFDLPGGVVALVLSDGHGAAAHFRSARGAELAIESVRLTLPHYIDSICDAVGLPGADTAGPGAHDGARISRLREFLKEIMRRWCALVSADVARDPLPDTMLPPAIAYGCTLLGAVTTPDMWMAFQLGDGAVLTVGNDGRVAMPVPDDERCRDSLTTSMCSAGADDFRIALGRGRLPLLMLMSDGLQNCFYNTATLMAMLPRLIARNLADTGVEATCSTFDGLLPVLSANGSHDDISYAWAMMPANLCELSPRLGTFSAEVLRHTLEGVDNAINDIESRVAEMEEAYMDEYRQLMRQREYLLDNMPHIFDSL